MKIFRYKPDLFPVTFVSVVFILDMTVFLFSNNILIPVAWMLLGIFPKACISSFGHHHQHLPTFYSSFLNRVYEIILGFQTGVTSHAWFLHHVLGHHRHYLDQVLDESRWKGDNGEQMGPLKYAVVVAATGYFRAYSAGAKFRKHRRIFVTMALIQNGLLFLFFWFNWVNALFVFLLPMGISYYITAWHTYYHHAGLETEDHAEASYNITHKWYNILTGNLGYHTAHHMKGGLHWSKLPEYHKTIEEKIPPHLFRAPTIPFRWMPAK